MMIKVIVIMRVMTPMTVTMAIITMLTVTAITTTSTTVTMTEGEAKPTLPKPGDRSLKIGPSRSVPQDRSGSVGDSPSPHGSPSVAPRLDVCGGGAAAAARAKGGSGGEGDGVPDAAQISRRRP